MAETDHTPEQSTANETVAAEAAYSSFVFLMDAHNELLQLDPKAENKEAYVAKVREFLKRAQLTGAVLHIREERSTAQSLLNYWITVLYRSDAEYKDDTATLLPYDMRAEVKIEDERCPYPGVRPFKESENKFFFGRQRQINYMLSRLREERLLAIVGPSGGGKTSLVVAGLLPEMKLNDSADKVERHYFPVITPGDEPLSALLKMVQQPVVTNGSDSHASTVNFQNEGQLLKLINQSTNLPAVIVIDQFHELFTRAIYSDCRRFLRNLGEVIKSPANHTVIVMMQEADYESVLRDPENFRKRIDPARVSLPSLASLELRDAIEKPGAYVGIKFPESVIKALVNETMSDPIGLPLLQFMLFKLWSVHKETEDLAEAFGIMRSPREALAASAEDFFKKLDLRDSVTCRRLLKQLVTFDNNFKPSLKSRKRADLYLHTESDSRVDSLIDRLAENQLVRLSPGTVTAEDEVELTHDSLLRDWQRMKDWVDSLKARRKRHMLMKVAAVLLLVVLAGLALSFGIGWVMEGYKSRELARLSKQELADERFDHALFLGLASYQTDHNDVSRGTLLKLLHNFQFSPRPERFLSAENFSPVDLSFSSESDRNPAKLAAINEEGRIIIWSLNWTQGSIATTEDSFAQERFATYPIIFSPDSKMVATASTEEGASAILWDINSRSSHKLSLPNVKNRSASAALAFSPQGRLLYSGGEDGHIVQWDITNLNIPAVSLFQHKNAIRSIAVNREGDRMVVGDKDGEVFLLELDRPGRKKLLTPVSTTALIGGIYNVTFNHSDTLVAASYASANGDMATVWNVGDGRLQREFCTGLYSGLIIAFTGEALTGFNTSGVVFSWNVEFGGLQNEPLHNPLLASTNASFSARGNFVALPSPRRDGAIIWDLSPARGVQFDRGVTSLAFKPKESGDIKETLLIGRNGGIEVLRTDLYQSELASREKEEEEDNFLNDVAYSRDGTRFAVAFNDGTVRVRDKNEPQKIITLARNLTGTTFKESIGEIEFDPVQRNRLATVITRTDNKPTNEETAEHLGTDEIVFWDIDTATEIQFPQGKPQIENSFHVTDIAFPSDGKLLIWASTDDKQSKITVWDLSANTIAREFLVLSKVSTLAIHPKQELLAIGLSDGTIQLIDLDNGERRYSLTVLSGEIADLAFSPTGGELLACATNPMGGESQKLSAITLWNTTSREQLGNSLSLYGAITRIAFSPDGSILASGSSNGTVQLWGPLDVNVTAKRFCEVIDCKRTYSKVARNHQTNPLDADSFFQRFYRWVMGRQSLKSIHNVETP